LEKLTATIVEQLAAGTISKQAGLALLEALRSDARNAPQPVPVAPGERIALIGTSCRLAGIDTPSRFWSVLEGNEDVRRPFPRGRLDDVFLRSDLIYENLGGREKYEELQARRGYFLDDIDRFDAEFFEITPAEAAVMDPRQRVFFETAWEALEASGLTRKALKHSRTGIYVAFNPEFPSHYAAAGDLDDILTRIANNPGNIGYRLSYWLDTRGPTLAVNTTCSSSLVAVHLARQALLRGECDIALVGGASAAFLPEDRSNVGIEAEDGICRPFDAAASGTVFGEGFGAVVMKRLSDALEAGDNILAVLSGSAIGSDGKSNGLTAPNPDAQADVIRAAWIDARVNAEDISYIECHGAATKLGDPIEVQGISSAFRHDTQKTSICRIGSVKANVGHTGDSAGLTALIKTVLCIKKRKLLPTLNFLTPNPLIPFEKSPVFVSSEVIDWLGDSDGTIRAGVSSFGVSGTNAHVVVECAPPLAHRSPPPELEWILPLSARDRTSLGDLVQKYADFLESSELRIDDICYTAACHRDHYPMRVAVVAKTLEELRIKLRRLASWRTFEEMPANFASSGIIVPSMVYEPKTPATRVAYSYANGETIEWSEQFAGAGCRKLTLPTYAFARRRHWLPLTARRASSADSLFHSLAWHEQALPVVGPAAPRDATWVVFCDELGIGTVLSDELESRGRKVIRLSKSTAFERRDAYMFNVRPGSEEDLQSVFSAFSDETSLEGVAHLWTCGRITDVTSVDALEETQSDGPFTLLALGKVLLRRGQRSDLQIDFITSYARDVPQFLTGVVPWRVTGGGLVRVLSQENPWIADYAIDVDPEGSSPVEIGRSLAAEMLVERTSRESIIAYRGGRRFYQALDVAAASEEESPIEGNKLGPVKSGGTYVIAGGLGYLGIALAKHLSAKTSLNLVLLGRSPFPDRDQWEAVLGQSDCPADLRRKLIGVMEIERQGSRVLCLSADVTRENELAAAMERTRSTFGAINGVVVAMKQLFHQRVDEISFADFRTGILNRVLGTWLLDHLTRSDDRDFIVLLSSISSIMGAKGASECCAVNQFLDSYGPYLNKSGLRANVITLTLVEDERNELVGDTAIPPIDPSAFLNAYDAIMSKNLESRVVAQFDFNVVRDLLPIIKIRYADDLLARFRPSPSLSDLPERPHLPVDTAQLINQVWYEVLGYQAPAPEDNFFDWGGTSLSVLKFVKLISERAKIRYSVTDVYRAPTIRGMRATIAQQLNGSSVSDVQKDRTASLDDLLAEMTSSPEMSLDEAMQRFESIRR